MSKNKCKKKKREKKRKEKKNMKKLLIAYHRSAAKSADEVKYPRRTNPDGRN